MDTTSTVIDVFAILGLTWKILTILGATLPESWQVTQICRRLGADFRAISKE